MYKKVTHSILEEHFDHPMAVEIKNSNTRASVQWPFPPTVFVFQSAMRTQFNQLDQSLRDVIISTQFDNLDLDFNKLKLYAVVTEFSTFFAPYYGQSNSDVLIGHLNAFSLSFIDILAAIKSGIDFSIMQATAINHLIDFNKTMYSLNGQWWTVPFVTPDYYLTEYANWIITEAVKRKSFNWEDAHSASTTAFKIIANGPLSTAPYNGNMDFSFQLSNSIPRQFPDKFS